jgi:LysM repeat protein
LRPSLPTVIIPDTCQETWQVFWKLDLTTEPDTSPRPAVFDFSRRFAKLASPEVWGQLISVGVALILLFSAIRLARMDAARIVPVALASGFDSTPAPTAEAPAGDPLPQLESAAQAPSGDLTRLADIHTTIPTRPRYDVVKYTIVRNDTLFGVAAKFNLKPETILWGNSWLAENPNFMPPGRELNILPIDGALRIVQPGDTLEKIARVFHGTVEEIVNFPGNELDPNDPQIREGQSIIIPGGWRDLVVWQLPVVSRRTRGIGGEPGSCAGPFSGPSGTGVFAWPANNRFLSGTDYLPNGHPGIDIAAGMGAPIFAADTGVVVFSGWSTRGYGNLVIIDHGNGWQTAYAHLSQINVGCGFSIFQGQLLGLSGSTGNSSGAHLHFEMRSDAFGRVNPWLYLP